MEQPVHESDVADAVVDILAAAVDEYLAAFADIADEVDHGRVATSEQLERAMTATLQLENAQTLFELDAGDRYDAATSPRSVH